MRIVYIITGLRTGGAEQVLIQLLEASYSRGYEPYVISLIDEGTLGNRIRKLNVRLETVGMRPGSLNLFSLYRLRKIVEEIRPDIIHGWMYHGNIAAAIAAFRKYPIIWGIHHSLHDIQQEKWLTRQLIKSGAWISCYINNIVYCSDRSAKQHEAIGYDCSKSVIIHNGFNTDVFQPTKEARLSLIETLGLPDDALIVGHAARFHPMKNHIGLLEAFASISKQYPTTFLVLIGPGVDDKNTTLMNIVREHKLHDRVRLLGERNDIEKIMPGFDIYVSTSAWGEAFPVVLGEAMASGVPCIATDIGDSALLLGETGYVVPAPDSETLVTGFNTLLQMTPEQRQKLGQLARWRICEHFSLASMTEKYASVYETVLT